MAGESQMHAPHFMAEAHDRALNTETLSTNDLNDLDSIAAHLFPPP